MKSIKDAKAPNSRTDPEFLAYVSLVVFHATMQLSCREQLIMLSVWHQKRQEESYLVELEQIVVQRIRVSDQPKSESRALSRADALSEFSRELNEELLRIESLVEQYDNA